MALLHHLIAVCQAFRVSPKATITVEFALIAPILIVIMLGAVEITNYMAAVTKVEHAAISSANYLSTLDSPTNAQISNANEILKGSLTPFPSTDEAYSASFVGVKIDFNGLVSTEWERHFSDGTFDDAEDRATAIGGSYKHLVLVKVSHKYTPVILDAWTPTVTRYLVVPLRHTDAFTFMTGL